jgi:fumarate hydratase class II
VLVALRPLDLELGVFASADVCSDSKILASAGETMQNFTLYLAAFAILKKSAAKVNMGYGSMPPEIGM